jgi:uncharacterized membrane protein YjgN (DUF898 family)
MNTDEADVPSTTARPNPDPPGTHRLALRFVGSGSEYFRIWIVNLLLTLVTLGLYYPFAKVRRLRYFHGATEVGGHAMSFHANPWKMFRGYVLVVVLLGAYALAGQFSPTAGAVAFLIVAGLWPALWHSSLRFRLANTGWRGLRFRYTGTRAQAYLVMGAPFALGVVFVLVTAWLAPGAADAQGGAVPPGSKPAEASPWLLVMALAPLLLVLGLGPLFLWLVKRQQHAHYALGDEHTRFGVGAGSFYALVLKAAGVAVLVGLAAAAMAAGVAVVAGMVSAFGGDGVPPNAGMVLGVLFVILAYLIVWAVAGGYFVARLQNLVWSGTSSAHLRFASGLRARALAGLWFRNTVLVLLTLGLYFPFAQVASARLRLEAVAVTSLLDPERLVAAAAPVDESAAGDAAGDLFGFDIGL